MSSAKVMQRRSYWVDHFVLAGLALGRRRLTGAGLVVLLGLGFAAASGFDTDKSLTHQVFALLLALTLLGLAFSLRFRVVFTAWRSLPRYGSAGVRLSYRIRVRNDSKRLQSGLRVTEHWIERREEVKDVERAPAHRMRWGGSFRLSASAVRARPVVARIGEGELPALPPGGEAEVAVEWMPLRRGVVCLRGVSLVRTDPFGLFKSRNSRPLPGQVVILPKRYPLPALALPGAARYQQGGVALAASVGQSDEFVGLRDYRPGDPLRHIDWKAWARAGKPIVREFEDEFFVRHALILDTFTDEQESAVFEEAVSVAASFACTVRTQESLLDLLFVGLEAYCFTAGRGLGHTEQLLEVLAAARECVAKPFSSLSHLVLNHASQVSGCVVILIDWDEARRALLSGLRSMGAPLLVLLVVEPARAAELREDPQIRGSVWLLEVGDVARGLMRLEV